MKNLFQISLKDDKKEITILIGGYFAILASLVQETKFLGTHVYFLKQTNKKLFLIN